MYVQYLVQQSVCTNALLSHVCTFNTVCEAHLNRNRLTVNKCLLKELAIPILSALMNLTLVQCGEGKATAELQGCHRVLEQC